MSRYKTGQIGLRWRTEKEVISGKGQFVCGNKHCDGKDGLASYEVNFSYYEAEEHKQALVKLVACERCAGKLRYKKRKEHKRSERKEKKRKRERWSSEDGADAGHDERIEERSKGKKVSKWDDDRISEDDEKFDEYMEGMFPSDKE